MRWHAGGWRGAARTAKEVAVISTRFLVQRCSGRGRLGSGMTLGAILRRTLLALLLLILPSDLIRLLVAPRLRIVKVALERGRAA